MTTEEKLARLKEMTLEHMSTMTTALNNMHELFNESGESMDIDRYVETLALEHHKLIQTASMYAYFEMVKDGVEPLES